MLFAVTKFKTFKRCSSCNFLINIGDKCLTEFDSKQTYCASQCAIKQLNNAANNVYELKIELFGEQKVR